MIGMLWHELNPKRPLEVRMQEAIDQFSEKHGKPEVIHIGRVNMGDRKPFEFEGVQVLKGTVQPRHFIVYGNKTKGKLVEVDD